MLIRAIAAIATRHSFGCEYTENSVYEHLRIFRRILDDSKDKKRVFAAGWEFYRVYRSEPAVPSGNLLRVIEEEVQDKRFQHFVALLRKSEVGSDFRYWFVNRYFFYEGRLSELWYSACSQGKADFIIGLQIGDYGSVYEARFDGSAEALQETVGRYDFYQDILPVLLEGLQ